MIIFALIPILLFVLVKYWYNYWTRRNIPTLNSIPFGVLGPVVSQKQSFGEAIRDVYLRNKEPYLGIFFLFRPVLLIRDHVLVKRILVTDFNHFTDRGVHYDEVHDPIGANLMAMPGEKWRILRAKLSPTFSSSKLKNMIPTIETKVQLLEDHLDDVGSEVRLKRPMEFAIISILVEIFFGFEFNAFENPEHDFVKMAPLFFNPERIQDKIRLGCIFLVPDVMKWLRMPMIPPEAAQYALNMIQSIVELRKSDPSAIRNDFIQTMIELMKEDQKDGSAPMTIESCTAQAFAFYVAGMDSTSNTISYCIYELSKCPQWMEKVQREVDNLMKKGTRGIQYDDLMALKHLGMAITETMRMYPGLPLLNRECTKEYQIPGTDQTIKRGTQVIISNLGLHMDEEFYANPGKFDPSRFEDTSTEDLPYYPMGAGGRYCLGARMGLMNVRLVLCRLLYRYEFQAVNETIEFKPGNLTLTDKEEIHMRIKKRSI